MLSIAINPEDIAGFCGRNSIARLALFGSVLRPDFAENSDVDVLVEFQQGHVPGLLGLMGMQEEFSALVGRQVDLRTPKDLSRHFRDQVIQSAHVLYAD